MKNKVILACFLFILTASYWGWSNYQEILHKPVLHNTITIDLDKGDSFTKITSKLIDQGLTIHPLWFKVMAYKMNVINKLKVGEYELTPGLTIPQLLTLFAAGKAKKYSITFPEGFSLKQILQTLQNSPNLSKQLLSSNPAEIATQLGISEKNPEGLFFPDTYYFEKDTTDISLLKRAYTKMQNVLKQEWEGREANLPYQSNYEALIMASIIEKETGAKSERAQIAGVFVRRLIKNMLLQTDPTVIYGMGDRYQGNIRAKDLTTLTAYNTYVNPGLPPTPIAMPGQDAIHAALHPSSGDSLYFVAKGDGSHQFSATLAEHNQAVITFQKLKK